MTDDEIRAETARQIHNTFALLATKLRDQAQHHGPPIAKVLNVIADEITQLP